jgi:crossover junction endodeoxyribonuclease RuvC
MFAPVSPAVGRSEGTRVVLGIDPGLTRCGYAAVTFGAGRERLSAFGVLTTPRTDDVAQRLARLHADFVELLADVRPDAVAVERIFMQHNTTTAIAVAQASGVVLALAAVRGCDVATYTPSQVKSSLTGWGAADKAQMQRMVQMRFSLPQLPEPADAADAVAIALCHVAASPLTGRVRDAGVTR